MLFSSQIPVRWIEAFSNTCFPKLLRRLCSETTSIPLVTIFDMYGFFPILQAYCFVKKIYKKLSSFPKTYPYDLSLIQDFFYLHVLGPLLPVLSKVLIALFLFSCLFGFFQLFIKNLYLLVSRVFWVLYIPCCPLLSRHIWVKEFLSYIPHLLPMGITVTNSVDFPEMDSKL